MDPQHENFLKELGKQVRHIRKEKGLSMEALAYKANIEYRQLGRIERGEVNPTIISLVKVAEALNMQVNDFFY